MFHTIKLCLARQYLIQIGLIPHSVRNLPITNANKCPCDSAGFEHDIVHYFADPLYRRFGASVTQRKTTLASTDKKKCQV